MKTIDKYLSPENGLCCKEFKDVKILKKLELSSELFVIYVI